MTTKHYNRPTAAYSGEAGLTNTTKYYTDSTSSPKVPISSTKVDGDINYLIDAVNELYDTAVSGSLPDGAVTNAKMAARGACSVIGRAANSSGTPADISAATDDVALVRKSGALSFSTIPTAALDNSAVTTAKIADTNVTFAKVQNVNSGVLIGRGTSGSGSVEQISLPDGIAFSGTQLEGALAPYNTGYASNRYYSGNGFFSATNNSMTANTIVYVPFYVGKRTTFTRIGIKVTVLSAGNARLGVYAASDGVPATLLFDAGAVSTSATGNIEATISQALAPGVYFYAACFSSTPQVGGPTQNSDLVRHVLGSDLPNNDLGCLVESFTYGALPANAGTVNPSGINSAPAMWLRVV